MYEQKINHLQQNLDEQRKQHQEELGYLFLQFIFRVSFFIFVHCFICTCLDSIIQILNQNNNNQHEFQMGFKRFAEKFKENTHSNLTTLQEKLDREIKYLDNILRAEIKTRIKGNIQSFLMFVVCRNNKNVY